VASSELAAVLSAAPKLPQLPGQASNSWCDSILDDLADGVVVVGEDGTIDWANRRFRQMSGGVDDELVGNQIFAALGKPEILGPEFSPFSSSLALDLPCTTRLRVDDKQYYQLHVNPLHVPGRPCRKLVVVVRDITREVLQRQKLEAIHQAGIQLADLRPEEVIEMTVDDRINLLKSNVLHYTRDLFNFNVVEIRLLEQSTRQLLPLLAEGIDAEAAKRDLLASPQGNGVTGYVAFTGRSYLCEDTRDDPLYLSAFEGARSSLTVPLIWHDDVIGTFNVESPEPNAFSQDDLVFLEIFARDVAFALNTLQLLAVQGINEALRSVEAIHRAVALPVDQILIDAVHVLETYIGHPPEIKEKLRSILRNARDLRQLIQEVGQGLNPVDAIPAVLQSADKRRFRDVRVLVVDAEQEMRDSAHRTLERFGCTVETARSGSEAVLMVRASQADAPYDVIICDVRLPDMTGHNLQVDLKQFLVLMQGFGYDPGHSIVKARQDGLHPRAVLYKPFRVEQLLDVIQTILDWRKEP
jgi:CheY-like chemotaxis protein